MATKQQEAKVTFTADTKDFTEGIKNINSALSKNKSELSKVDEQLKDNANDVELLAKRHKLLQEQEQLTAQKTELLNNKTEAATRIFGENSREANSWTSQTNRAATAQIKVARAAREAGQACEDAANGVDRLGDESKQLEKEGKGAVSVLEGFATSEIGGQIMDAAQAMGQLVEETREYREDIVKLETAFQTAGKTGEQAAQTYRAIFAFTGEEDRSVEAAQRLAQLTENEEQLATWTNILTGVWGVYGDALPVEGLAEAANETAKVGTVTGVLADALNWAGVSEDDFNARLAECNSTSERTALITDTLNGLYSEAADNYRENAGSIIEARDAEAELAETKADLAAKMEPVISKFTELKSLFLQIVTAIPTPVLTALIIAISAIAAGLTVLGIVMGVVTVAQWAMNAAMLANPITWIVLGIMALIAFLALLFIYFDEIKAKFGEMWEGIKAKFQEGWEKIKAFFQGIPDFFRGLWDRIKQTFSDLGTKIGNAISGAVKSGLNAVIQFIENRINGAIDLINGAIGLINKIPGVNIGYIQHLSLPRLARGGIATGATTAIIGEAGPEAVVPLNSRYMRPFVQAITADINASGITQAVDSLHADLGKIIETYSPNAVSATNAYLTELARKASMGVA